MQRYTDTGKHQTAAPAQRGNEAGLAWTRVLEPTAPERRGQASMAMNISNVCVTNGTFQLQVAENIAVKRSCDLQLASSGPLSNLLIGSQNTENP